MNVCYFIVFSNVTVTTKDSIAMLYQTECIVLLILFTTTETAIVKAKVIEIT